MSSSNTNKTRKLSLYCPDLNKEVFNFLLTPSMTWNHMIVSIQAALQCQGKEVWPLDINGESFYDTDAVFNFASIQDGEKLFVKLREGFRITALPDLEVVLYLEEEDPDALPKSLKKTGVEAKRAHMEKLRRRDGVARKNICRIVLPQSEVKELLAALNNASGDKFKQAYSLNNSKRHLRYNWRVRTTEKTKDLTSDLRCFAMIAIFSKMLPGQHLLGEDFLLAAARARIETGGPSEPKDIQEQDVLDAIQNLYEAADAIDSTWDDTKDNKAMGKRASRNKSYKARKMDDTTTARDNADAEDMGEDAAEAAYIGKGKGKAVDKLADRLEKTMLPDNFMPDDDDDDDSDYED